MIDFCSPNMKEYYTTHEEGIEDAPSEIFMCHTGASIITFLWMGLKDVTYENVQPYVLNRVHLKFLIDNEPDILIREEIAFGQLRYLYGVYLMHISHSHETHSLVAWFKSDTITIYNSYGGYPGFFITTFQRNNWLDSFEDFFKMSYSEQRRSYHLLWGIRENMIQGIFYENYDGSPAGPVEFEDIFIHKIY